MSLFLDGELQIQVWAGGQAALGPSEACKLDLGIQGLRSFWRPWRTEEENKSHPLSQASDSQCLEGSSSSAQASGGSEGRALFWPHTTQDQLQGDKTEELTELAVLPSLLGGVRGGVPAHLSM